MTTETTLEQFVRERFGVLRSGKHNPAPDCPACILEAINACHDREWTDDPQVARTFDIRLLNDAQWPDDETRTRYMVRLGSLLDGSLDWPQNHQQAFVEELARETVRQIVAELPDLSEAARAQCRAATSMEECHVAAYAAADAAAAAYAANAANAANVLVKACGFWIAAAERVQSEMGGAS